MPWQNRVGWFLTFGASAIALGILLRARTT
jgi:hypothetical protein